MKIKNLLLAFFLCILVSPFLHAQTEEDKTVTLTVTGTGSTSDEAKEKALRNAIEQAFGAFISSRTEILNDELVSDQITSVASGNIKSYELLNEAQIPTGGYVTTLKATVSVNKLTSFVEAKGVSVEIKGGLFAMNVKQQMLNEQAEINTVYNMIAVLHEVMQTSFDYSISTGNPKSLDAENINWEIPLTVTVTANDNADFCGKYMAEILTKISLNTQEVESYKSLGKQVFTLELTYNGLKNSYFLRKLNTLDIIRTIIDNWNFYMMNFEVNSGVNSPVRFNDLENLGQDMLYIPWKSFENDYSRTLRILMPTSGNPVYRFSRSEKKTLSEIEKITGYSIEANGNVSKIKNGGYIVYEEKGHGLVISLLDFVTHNQNKQFDERRFQLDEAKIKCAEYVFSGYDDWRLPTAEECHLIFENLSTIGRSFSDFYWCREVVKNSSQTAYDFTIGSHFDPALKHHGNGMYEVFAVREFGNKKDLITTKELSTGSVKDSEIYTSVDEAPEFPGGMNALTRYIQSTFEYPVVAVEKNIQGKVFVKFVVKDNGSISDIDVERSYFHSFTETVLEDGSISKQKIEVDCPQCIEEAMRVVEMMPSWKAGVLDGKSVSTLFRLPFNFALE